MFVFSYIRSVANAQFDVVVVGGGIIGTATARELAGRHPHLSLAILEKEKSLGRCYFFFKLEIQ